MRPENEAFVPALGYRWLTPLYDVVVRATTRERRFKRALIGQAGILPGQRVLDLATGTGTLAIWIKQAQPAAEVTGVDVDPEILARAERKARLAHAEISLRQARSDTLPFPARYFDRVMSSLFFHHLTWQDKVRTAGELFRVMRPGAELHVADWGRPANPLMRGLFLAVQCLDGFATTRDNVAGRLVGLFEQAGFREVAESRRFSTVLGTLSLYRAVRPGA
ncbi:MAG: methyltransferase domain-containing protein [Steroidobacteraceae bacterium]|nr:methyltransferase domain-containing protein [Steroidobacteraceae bacterium]